MTYATRLLDSSHDRASFRCSEPSLTDYLRKQARQDLKRKVCAVYVLSADDDIARIVGYYSLSNASIPWDQLPESVAQRMPRYGDLPATLMGWLAVDQQFSGQGLGQFLLYDALARSLDHSYVIGSIAVVTDPLNDIAKGFYTKQGFISLDSGRMFLSMGTISQML